MELVEFQKLKKVDMVEEYEKATKKLASIEKKNDKLIAELSATEDELKPIVNPGMSEDEIRHILQQNELYRSKNKKLKKKLQKLKR